MEPNNLPAVKPEFTQRGIIPRNVEELKLVAEIAIKSGLNLTPARAMGVIAYGLELGLGPMAALGCIHVIEGKFEVNYAGVCALLTAHWDAPPEFAYEGSLEDETMKVICRLKRKGVPGVFEDSFDIPTAKRGGQWNRGYWKTNPRHMLRVRALTFAARQGFGDVLRGIYVEGELSEDHGEPVAVEATVKETRSFKPIEGGPAVEGKQSDPHKQDVAPAPPTLPEEDPSVLAEVEALDEQARKVRVGKRLMEMAGGEQSRAESLLIRYSTVNGRIGVRTLKSPVLAGERLVDLDHAVRDAYQQWKKEQKS